MRCHRIRPKPSEQAVIEMTLCRKGGACTSAHLHGRHGPALSGPWLLLRASRSGQSTSARCVSSHQLLSCRTILSLDRQRASYWPLIPL